MTVNEEKDELCLNYILEAFEMKFYCDSIALK